MAITEQKIQMMQKIALNKNIYHKIIYLGVCNNNQWNMYLLRSKDMFE